MGNLDQEKQKMAQQIIKKRKAERNEIKTNELKKEKKEKKQKENKDPYGYSRDNNHDTSNHGKRWKQSDLDIVWHLHYVENWDNMQIAQKFKRTDCGIMVQLDKMYKDKRDKEQLVMKKHLYQKHLDKIIKKERIWSEKEHKWVTIKEEESESEQEEEDESSSDEEDDIPIAQRMNVIKKETI